MAIAMSNNFGEYQYKFVDSPPDDLCKTCYHPCRDPNLTLEMMYKIVNNLVETETGKLKELSRQEYFTY